MKKSLFVLFAISLAALTGCATTGRNQQTDIDGLNARVNALQGQLAAKDQEINNLQNQVNDQRMAKEAAEAALRNADSEKQSLAAQLASSQSRKASTASDLK